MEELERKELLASGKWRQWVVQEARTWLYTPYQHKGRIKKVGVDCGGILYETYYQILGPFKQFPNDYPPDWSVHRENEIYLDFIMPYVVEVPRPAVGGFSLFQIGRNFGHAGIYTDRNTYIHAWGRNQVGCVIEEKPTAGSFKLAGKPRLVKHFDVSTTWLSSRL